MRRRDWALVAFTLLMQAAVGTLVVATAVSTVAGGSAPARPFDLSIAVAAALGGLALVVSVGHLGHPTQAWLALANVRRSWLSREIVASLLFVACAGALAFAPHRAPGGSTVAVAAVVSGLIAVYAMARLYMIPAQPAWNRRLTPLAFFATALLSGALIVVTMSPGEHPAAGLLALTAVGLVIAQIVLTPVYLAGLPREPAAAISAATLGSTAIWLTSARVALAVAALVLLLLPIVAGAPTSNTLAAVALTFVLLSELAGRVLFYAGGASIRGEGGQRNGSASDHAR